MFIVIEKFDKLLPTIVVSEDNGMPLIHETMEEAEATKNTLQDGIIVEY